MNSKNLKKESTWLILVGNPNSGKSLFFSRVSGAITASSNYHGTTTRIQSAELIINEQKYTIYDSPGLYDLENLNPEEEATLQILNDAPSESKIIFLLDATRLDKGIFLLSQLQERQANIYVFLTQIDQAKKSGHEIDIAGLELRLQTRLTPVSNLHDDLKSKLQSALIELPQEKKQNQGCRSCKNCSCQERYRIARQIKEENLKTSPLNQATSDCLDFFLLHPFWGNLSFLLITILFFTSIFLIASWPMNWIDQGFSWCSDLIEMIIPAGFFQRLVSEGILAGMNGTIIFIPQIFILFFMLNLLENSGYLARIVCLMDRFLKKFGLSGASFLPILSAHACAIPAILSTASIKNRKEKLRTIFILPFFSCSARLPVYIMLTALLFPNQAFLASLAFVACYLLGATVAILTAWIMKIKNKEHSTELLMELPRYRIPPLRLAWKEASQQSINFVKKAGTFIVCFSVVIWLLSATPGDQINDSYLAMIGKFIQPIFAPLGFDWTITVGILASFAAREVIVAALAVMYSANSEGSLLSTLQNVTNRDGELLFSFATNLSLLVFFIFALQCVPTIITTWRESGSGKFALSQFLYASSVAYLLAFLIAVFFG